MPVFLTSLFGFLGSATSGFFNLKSNQVKAVETSLDLLKTIDTNDATSLAATANALSVILSQGSWLERNWRPLLMLLLILMVACWFFGFIPPHFNDPVTPMMDRVLTMLTIGVGGYIPARTIDKAIQQFNIGSILKTLIEKKFS